MDTYLLEKREIAIIRLALIYMRANLDEVNEVLEAGGGFPDGKSVTEIEVNCILAYFGDQS